MRRSSKRSSQQNEIGWWSSWARLVKPTRDCLGLFSREFAEPLFNRGVFLVPPESPRREVRKVMKKFEALGARPAFFVPDSKEFSLTRRALSEGGFRPSDRFLTLELVSSKLQRDRATRVREISDREVGSWSGAYLEAFYGDQVLLAEVLRSATRSRSKRGNRLIVATRNRKVVGMMALRTSHGYTGVYCLGTVPSMRGMGVASSMLVAAEEFSRKSRTKVVLQTFEADKIEGFYLARGFKRSYAEDILTLT